MKWDYWVFKEENGDCVIREVFYEEDNTIISCTKNAVEPVGRTLTELAEHIEWFKTALKLPVLTLADIPKTKKKKRIKDRSKNLTREELGLS